LAQVYVELTGGRQIGLHLAVDNAEADLAEPVARIKRDRPLRAARPHAASEEELAAHAQFLDTLKEPLWRT
jgi:DNA polymerase-3 subunit epsilon